MYEITKKCTDCKNTYALDMFIASERYSGAKKRTIRCLGCRRIRRKKAHASEIEAQQYAIEAYGQCSVRGCLHPRIKTSHECINHMGANEDVKPPRLVRLWSLHCLFCSWYTYCRGTSEQARISALSGLPPCRHCGGMLELIDEGMVVGREYSTHTSDIGEKVPSTGPYGS